MPVQVMGVQLFNLREAATELGVSYLTAKTYHKKGRLKGQRIGRSIMVTGEELRRFVASPGHAPSLVTAKVRQASEAADNIEIDEQDLAERRLRSLAYMGNSSLRATIKAGIKESLDVDESIKQIRAGRIDDLTR